MKHQWKRPRAVIPLACYGAAALLWLALCGALLVSDTAGRLTGRLAYRQMQLADFEQLALELTAEDGFAAATADPQLIWYNPGGVTVRTVTLAAEYDSPPGEICLYYVENEGEAFGRDKRVFPRRNADGSYTFVLPRADLYALRLDPCSDICTLSGVSIEYNTAHPFWRYFIPSWKQLFGLCLWPGLAASALSLLRQGLLARRGRRAGRGQAPEPEKGRRR